MARLDRKLVYLILALVATLLYMVSIGYYGWPCNDSILGPKCINNYYYRTTGGLLLAAGLVIFVSCIFIIIAVTKGFLWAGFAAMATSILSAILAVAAMFYYFDHFKVWSPFLASIAMSLTIAISGMMIFDLINQRRA